MFFRSMFPASLLVTCSLLTSLATAATTVKGTILVLARSTDEAYDAYSGLNGHGIPYQLVVVPQEGITLPTLNSSATSGNYGGIITLSELSYDYGNDTYRSALTDDQYDAIYAYQVAFGVRLVRLDAYPQPAFGTTPAGNSGGGCCADNVEQYLQFSDVSAFPTAQIKTNANVSTEGLWHYASTITNTTLAKEIAYFSADSAGQFSSKTTAAVINDFGNREQLVWFISWGTKWSQTSNYIQHAHINWLTRGLYVGRRRIYLNTQVDDMLLATDIYQPANTSWRLRTTDLDAHVTWQADINTRLPAGSAYKVEIGYNGNGDIEQSVNINDDDNTNLCNPDTGIEYDYQATDPPLEFVKPLGTGINYWPSTPKNYSWSANCIKLDPLSAWFQTAANRNHFCHISHTFTHLNLDNSTYSDTYKEIQFNQKYLAAAGLSDSASCFTSNGIIPPAITGIHNGDALRAWHDTGILQVVGDSSRPLTLNQQNEHWPYITSVAADGYDGIIVLPRWALAMYYNCYDLACSSAEWIATSQGWGDVADLLIFERTTRTSYMLALHHDAFMFHQANMRYGDVGSITVGSQSGQLSMLMTWTELISQEMMRLTNWPMVSIKQQDLATQFTNRMAQDKCSPTMSYTLSTDGKSITAVTVGATGNTCSAPIPITIPVTATASCSGCTTLEKLGSDSPTYWTKLSGSAVTFTLSTPITL